MNEQQTAALQSMKKWLSHPGELGKEPSKIEMVGEFDLYDLHYYIFKYKKGIFGQWLLGVCGGYEQGETDHCGHVFSEMETYNESDAKEKAIAMVEMIRKHWMDQAKELDEKEAPGEDEKAADHTSHDTEDEDSGVGAFVGFVLLSKPQWNKEQFKSQLKADWDIDCVEDVNEDASENDTDALIFNVDHIRVVVAMMDAPVPNGEAETNAANNYMWPDAVEVVKTHKAQLIVAILGEDEPLVKRGCLLVKILSVCCKQESVLGIYTSGTVFQPAFYADASEMLKEGNLPILNWIYFGLYQTEGGWNTYTFGMKAFGKDEMEVLEVKADPEELRNFLMDMVYYVLDADTVLKDGETIGFTEEQKIPIIRSKGVSLNGYTIKIGCTEATFAS